MYKLFKKNRKAQIPTTVTWIAAFLIIFFIMILFISWTSALTGKKYLSAKNKIEISNGLYKIETTDSQKNLIKVLNTNLILNGETISVYELIVKWGNSDKNVNSAEEQELKKKIEEGVGGILSFYKDCYYIFYLDIVKDSQTRLAQEVATSDPQAKEQGYNVRDLNPTIEVTNLKYFDKELSKMIIKAGRERDYETYLKNAYKFKIIGTKKDIEIKFYLNCEK